MCHGEYRTWSATNTTYTTAKRSNDYSYYFAGDGSDYLFTFNADDLSFRIEVVEQQPVGLIGDVNEDGILNIQDVTMLIDHLLGSEASPFNTNNADINQDSIINISDVTLLIDLLLQGWYLDQ